MRHLVDSDLLALFQARKEEYAKHEPDYTAALAAVAEEAAWNKEFVNSPLGLRAPPKTEAKDALASEQATYNRSYDSLNRTRELLVKEMLNSAEIEYVQAALAMKEKWGQLHALSCLSLSAKMKLSTISTVGLYDFCIPGADTDIMRRHVSKVNNRWSLTNPIRDANEWGDKLKVLREEIGL